MTATDLVSPDLSVEKNIELIRRAQRIIAVSDIGEEILDTIKRAKLGREWVKISKAAKELAVEATRLEATALRRLGQLEFFTGLPINQKPVAQWFASQTEEEFKAVLAEADKSSSAVGLWRRWQRQSVIDEAFRRGGRIATGEDFNPEKVTKENLAQSAKTVLDVALSNDETISVSSAAFHLAEQLGLEIDYFEDAAIRSGLAFAIRQAFREHLPVGDDEHYPGWITYYQKDLGFVRIPWNIATVEQVLAWAAFREEQANMYIEAAAKASEVGEEVRVAAKKYPRVKKVVDLLKAEE